MNDNRNYINRNLPRISIVTPSYNQGQYLESTILSIINQEYNDLEYIIIDGGSSDNSLDIIKKYDKKITYWVSEPDQGQYHAINKGFSISTGDVMLWINSDDMLVPKSLSAISAIFRDYGERINWISGIPAYFDKQGNLFRIFKQVPYNRTLMRCGGYDGRALGWVMQECTVWTRRLWESAGGFVDDQLNYAGDFELWLRFSKYCQLYNVSMLIGANRQWSGQKTLSDVAYYREVDAVLDRDKLVKIINRALRATCIKLPLRIYGVLTNDKNSVAYNARDMEWRIVD